MVWTALVNFVNWLIDGLGSIVSAIFILLPNSPFSEIDYTPIFEFVGYLNYVVPVGKIVVILSAWGSCIGLYYLYQIVLRWAKVVE